ncbi:YafY family protein [Paenibacillus sp. JTLBN-2024]|jgi:predicted DNA-binding transcriptional regulator YafY|uniref:Transcriptional regulator n=1 Tax=Paenibacillus cookii TaxID=157839 RepID=A0ABQ4M028_9BACL|nr:YafY family protein [Paenibacillus cookii]KHF37528.1 HTH domain protein [Paenibacillus sp. P1XP2]GIO68886.1 transcriptional regulator [Paenibacillus cookii]HWO55460.1 YafY family protein [Paenibacillus cookii]
MNRTDRLLAIVLELQSRKIVRAEELAERFETSVRTIYRDMQALSEANVPVVGAPGQGYSLMEGYFLPPVSLTAAEAVALLLGAEFVQKKLEPNYGIHAASANAKIEAVLPQPVRAEAGRIRATMRLLQIPEADAGRMERENLELVRGALLERKKIRFRYAKAGPGTEGSRVSERTAAPYGLIYDRGAWLLVAACELRGDIRHFRVSRMSELRVLADGYELPDGFDLEKYRPADDRELVILLSADRAIEGRIRESDNYYIDALEEHPDGLHIRMRVRRIEEVLQWIMGWGSAMTVLEPEALRERIRNEAEKLLKRY